jgi:hypothetical protein
MENAIKGMKIAKRKKLLKRRLRVNETSAEGCDDAISK